MRSCVEFANQELTAPHATTTKSKSTNTEVEKNNVEDAEDGVLEYANDAIRFPGE